MPKAQLRRGGHVAPALARYVESRLLQGGDHVGAAAHRARSGPPHPLRHVPRCLVAGASRRDSCDGRGAVQQRWPPGRNKGGADFVALRCGRWFVQFQARASSVSRSARSRLSLVNLPRLHRPAHASPPSSVRIRTMPRHTAVTRAAAPRPCTPGRWLGTVRDGVRRGTMTANSTGATATSTGDRNESTTTPLTRGRGRDTDEIRQARAASDTEKARTQKCDRSCRVITPRQARR